MTLFDTPCMISYGCSIVTMALFCAFSEIFHVENITTLKFQSKVQQDHWVVPFDRLVMVCC